MEIVEKKTFDSNLRFYLIWSCLFLFAVFFFIIGIDHESVWFDESFTYAITNHPIDKIFEIVAKDNHPPLYFILITVFSAIFGKDIVILRLFSVIGVMLLFSLSLYPLRRMIGNKGALFYAFFITIIPVFSSLAQDARMYTWGSFFVTASLLFGYGVLREQRISNWILFGLLTLCAASTHYYALIAVTFINLFLFIYFIVKNRKKLIPYSIFAIVMIIIFSPILVNLLTQIGQVSKNYWIPNPNYVLVSNSLTFLFKNKFCSYSHIFDFFGILVTGIVVFYSIRITFRKKNEAKFLVYLCLFVYCGTFLFVLIYSIFVKPILFPRYMLNTAGAIVILCSFGLSELRNKTILLISVLYILFSFPQQYYFRVSRLNGLEREAAYYIDRYIKESDVFFHGDEFTMGPLMYYYPNNRHYLYMPKGFVRFTSFDAFGKNLTYGEMNADIFKNTDKIWLTNTKNYPITLSLDQFYDKSFSRLEDRKVFEIDSSEYTVIIDRFARSVVK